MGDLLDAVRRAEESQRSLFSDIAYKELKALYELTVETWFSDVSVDSFLGVYAGRIQESFSADETRIYISDSPRSSKLKLAARSGGGALDDEVSLVLPCGKYSAGRGGTAHRTRRRQPRPGRKRGWFHGDRSSPRGHPSGSGAGARSGCRDAFKTRDLKMLGLFAAQMGCQLHNLMITQNLLRKNRELEQINMLTQRILQPRSLAGGPAGGFGHTMLLALRREGVFIPWAKRPTTPSSPRTTPWTGTGS
jgi:hypothetical protein